MASSNGTYIQQVAELLEELNILINANIISGQTTTVDINNIVTQQPDIITVVEYESFPKPPATVTQQITKIPTPPIIKKVTIKDAYLLNCGSWNPGDIYYKRCMDCVDSWISEHPDVRPTKTRTGCTPYKPRKKNKWTR